MYRMRRNIKGTSLVEVLVVMVVLLVGIMTVIQMFPTGFGVVRAAESRTIATKLAQQEIERWKSMSANLPTGILPIDADGNVLNGQYPGSPFAAFTGNSEPYARGNVLNIRWVREETTPIPAPVYFTTGTGSDFGSRYTLAFSPIDVYTEDDGDLNGLSVKSGPLKRIVSPSMILPALKQGQYAVYYGNEADKFYVAFPQDSTGVKRVYYISYSYWAEGPEGKVLMSELNQRVPETDLLDGPDISWQEVKIDPPSSYDAIGVEPNTDTCARGFILVTSGNWSADPYEFKLADPILGVLAFNPNAQRLYEYTSLGKRPIEAHIDYRIYDPRIIREDKVVPDASDSAESIPIKLALRFILDAGDPNTIDDGDPTDNPDEPTFEGLVRGIDGKPQLGVETKDAGDLIIPFSMMIVDLKTGFRVGVPNPSNSSEEGIPIDSIDYKTGVVNLPLSGCLMDYENKIQATVDLRGRQLRFFYRADGDWSVQCQKAYSNYSRVYDDDLIDYCHYRLVDGNRLLFAPCDAEKTVSIDYTYIALNPKSEMPDGTGEHRVVGQSCQISDTDDGNGYYYVDIPVPVSSYEIKRIAVIGTSFKARVIWRDGKHWRYVDQETNIIRGSD